MLVDNLKLEKNAENYIISNNVLFQVIVMYCTIFYPRQAKSPEETRQGPGRYQERRQTRHSGLRSSVTRALSMQGLPFAAEPYQRAPFPVSPDGITVGTSPLKIN